MEKCCDFSNLTFLCLRDHEEGSFGDDGALRHKRYGLLYFCFAGLPGLLADFTLARSDVRCEITEVPGSLVTTA